MKLYIGFGANIGQRAATIYEAIRQLGERIGPVKACSSLYETAPVGFSSPNRFLNAVAEFDTTLSPEQLLLVTQDIEKNWDENARASMGSIATALLTSTCYGWKIRPCVRLKSHCHIRA